MERRRDRRATGSIVRRISALVRPGQSMTVMDLSPAGALVAGQRPLRPGARVQIHLETNGRRAAIGARVVRCIVGALGADSLVYHAGLSFESRFEWISEPETRGESDFPERSFVGIAEAVHPLPAQVSCAVPA
jgi:PilZ domain